MVQAMNSHASTVKRLAASLMLCVLAIASMAAPICPACSKLELPSSHHIAFNITDRRIGQDCDRDGCSCCGFQIVPAPLGPTLALAESTSVSEFSSALPKLAPVFALYRPPRS
jgi:hypothetical protein